MDPLICRLKLASAALLTRTPFPTQELFAAFSTPEGILSASPGELERVAGLRPKVSHALVSSADHARIFSISTDIKRHNIRVVSFEDSEYPGNLKQIPDSPPVLFVKGNVLPEDSRAIAVIGSRKASPYGIALCEKFVQGLVKNGYCVISGMARGIDTVAHWTAQESQGRTIGVLGTGLDVVYPKANATLFRKMPKQGALLTEYLPGTPPLPGHFPPRNRIISGMALGVLVVEAAEKSGTMITVRMALEQGREVFALPGDVRAPLSKGTHKLIKDGAKLVESVEDILDELPDYNKSFMTASSLAQTAQPFLASKSESGGKSGLSKLSGEAETLLALLSDEGLYVDMLVQRTGWDLKKMSTVLTQMELLGKVKRLPGNRYLRIL